MSYFTIFILYFVASKSVHGALVLSCELVLHITVAGLFVSPAAGEWIKMMQIVVDQVTSAPVSSTYLLFPYEPALSRMRHTAHAEACL